MKTFILASLLALTAVSGAVITSQPAAADKTAPPGAGPITIIKNVPGQPLNAYSGPVNPAIFIGPRLDLGCYGPAHLSPPSTPAHVPPPNTIVGKLLAGRSVVVSVPGRVPPPNTIVGKLLAGKAYVGK